MAIDMKQVIAEASAKLIFEKHMTKLTVKDIADECNITRQTFYYHFADIPELLAWVVRQKSDELEQHLGESLSVEDSIRYCLAMGITMRASIKKMEYTNYWEEFKRILYNRLTIVMGQIIDNQGLAITEEKREYLVRYHCHATIGLISSLTDKETEDVDTIVPIIRDIIMGKLTA